jgi:DNA-binding LacI/PurR family transcriptional regulator
MNMRKVAQLAGVSSATVSRVMNGSGLVRPDTAEKVRQVITELNFVPNPHATTLKYGRSQTFGVIIPDLTNPFYSEFARDLEGAFVEHDQELLIANTHSDVERMQHSIQRMLLRRVDGVALLASEYETERFESLIRNRIPVVTLDRRKTAKGLSDVAIDFESGMEQAVRYLRELGHKRIGFLGGGAGIATSRVRQEAFVRALRAAGLGYNEKFVKAGDYRIPGGKRAMSELLSQRSRPTAVLTANDLTAFGALSALRDHGVRVPEEMSVIGCDDIIMSDIVEPPLTTIRISRRDLAKAFYGLLREADKDVTRRGRQISIEQKLVVRQSATRPLKRSRNGAA